MGSTQGNTPSRTSPRPRVCQMGPWARDMVFQYRVHEKEEYFCSTMSHRKPTRGILRTAPVGAIRSNMDLSMYTLSLSTQGASSHYWRTGSEKETLDPEYWTK